MVCSRVGWSLAGAAVVAGWALVVPGARGDEDSYKLLGLRPPVRGPAVGGANAARAHPGGGVPDATFPSSNVALRAWIPLNNFPDGANQTSAADCWGYASPSGREYAIIGLRRGTAFVEITDPGSPVQVGYVAGPNSLWKDVTVIGHHAYACSEGGQGIQVIDLSQIDSGVVTHVRNVGANGHSTTHTLVSNPESGFLYACGSNLGGLLIYDTNPDPANPALAGHWTGRYVHEAQIVTYTSGPMAGREIAYCFPIFTNDGLDVVDVTTKGAPALLATGFYPNANGSHQGWLSEDRRYLYIDDELDEDTGQPPSLTRIMDVLDPATPAFAGTFTSGATAKDHNQYVHNGRIYQANYTSGLRVFDAADPLNPVPIGFFDTHPESDNAGYNGAWGNYPFFPSGIVIVSDINRGLFVLEVGGSATVPNDPSAPAAVETAPGIAHVTWTDNADNEDEFHVERQQRDGNRWSGNLIVATPPANASSHDDTPAPGGWRYRVRALNGAGPSGWTAWRKLQLGKPTGLAASHLGAGEVRFAWTDTSGLEAGFTIQRQQKSGGTWTATTAFSVGPNVTSLDDFPGPGQFRYRVRAFSNGNNSDYAKWVQVTVP